jgi:hypothetical protein
MANFEKFGNLSTKGWDNKTTTQTIGLGQNAHIGLWGGGPSGEDLEVSCLNEMVCVAHEEPRPRQARWRHFLLTALQDGETEVQALVPSSSAVYARMTVKVVGKAGVRLVFFPGERLSGTRLLGTIYVIGGHGEAIPATGGPAVAGKNPKDGGHTFEPTPAGIYSLGPKKHVIAPSWTTSAIPWGATLRINKDGEVEYQDDSGKGGWHLVTGPKGVLTQAHFDFKRRSGVHITMAEAITTVRNALIDTATLKLRMTTWEFNDFGRWGWNLRRGGKPTAYFVHTTPDDERTTAEGKAVFLANSHGCIHIRPNDRDDFIGKGYLNEGVEFDVRPYSETGPP